MKVLGRRLGPAQFLAVLVLTLVGACPMYAVVTRAEHSRECIMCHITWGEGYEELAKDLPPPRYDVIIDGMRERNSSVEMCWSCHDGFVLDDRESFSSPDVHLQALPDRRGHGELPLDRNREMYCGTCHTPHSHKMGRKFDMSPFLRKSAADSRLCLECHADHKGGRWNHPLGVRMETARGRELSSDNAPSGLVECLSCHEFHRHASVRRTKGGDRSGLCSSCHQDKFVVVDSDHDLRDEFPEGPAVDGSRLMDGDVCAACHGMHKAPTRGSLAAGMDGMTADPSASPHDQRCLACHVESGAAGDKSHRDWGHPLGVAVNADSRPGSLPLPDGRVMCITCHDPHAWATGDQGHGLAGNQEGTAATSFLRIPDEGSGKLCSMCHSRQSDIQGSDHGPTAAFLEAGGVDAWACTVCHNTHGSQPYARHGRDGAFSAATQLCLSCHAGPGSSQKQGSWIGEFSHFIGVRALPEAKTAWLDAGPDGYVGCETCHDPHRWSPVGLAWQEGDDGNEAGSFLKCDNRQSAMCLACHQQQAGMIGGLHDGSDDPGEDRGPCAACHQPHWAVSEGLFARTLVPSNLDSLLRKTDWPGGSQERQAQNWIGSARACLACHHSQAGNQLVPGAWTHPRQVATLRPDELGGTAELVTVNCGSCHDPHMPARDRFSASQVEFLKRASAETVCADCHRDDALWRYTFFHDRQRRRK